MRTYIPSHPAIRAIISHIMKVKLTCLVDVFFRNAPEDKFFGHTEFGNGRLISGISLILADNNAMFWSGYPCQVYDTKIPFMSFLFQADAHGLTTSLPVP